MNSSTHRRVAVIGCGLWGRNIVRDLVELGCAPAVADPSPRARSEATALGATTVSEDWQALGEVEAYFVATPASTHVDVVEELAATERPLFVEKPMALSFADAMRMAVAAGPRLFVLHVWRYHAAIRELGRLYRSGELGAVRWLASRRMNWTSPRTDCDPVWTLLPHDLSIFLEITGELPEAQAAFAERTGPRLTGMVAHLGEDVRMVAEVSARSDEKVREVRLVGERGVAVMRGDGLQVHVHEGGADDATPAARVIRLKGESALQTELEVCLAHLDGGETPRSAIDDALLIQARMRDIRHLAGVEI